MSATTCKGCGRNYLDKSKRELDASIIQALRADLKKEQKRVEMLTVALERIRDCHWLPEHRLRQKAGEAIAELNTKLNTELNTKNTN